MFTEQQLVRAVEQILGKEADLFRREQTMWWGDALLYSAQRSFITIRAEDENSAMVRHAISLLDDDLYLDTKLLAPEPIGITV